MGAKLRVSIICLYAAVFVACGKAEIPNDSEFGSSTPQSRNDGSSSVVINEHLDCSAMTNASLDYNVTMTSYFDSASQSYNADLGRIRFKETPVSMQSGSNDYMQLYRWGIALNGQRDYNNTPVSFYIQLRSTGQYLVLSQSNSQNNYTSNILSRALFTNAISINNLSGFGVTVDNFLEQVLVVATGLENLDYKALTFANYRSGESSAYSSDDILIPSFAADPNLYAATQASTQLQQLHPLWHLSGQGWSEAEYLNEGNKNCL